MGYIKFENVKIPIDIEKILSESEEREKLQSIKIERIYQSTKVTKSKRAQKLKYIIVETEYTNGWREAVCPWRFNGVKIQGEQEYMDCYSRYDDNKMIQKVLGEYQLCGHKVEANSTAKVGWIFSIPDYVKKVEVISMTGERIPYIL